MTIETEKTYSVDKINTHLVYLRDIADYIEEIAVSARLMGMSELSKNLYSYSDNIRKSVREINSQVSENVDYFVRSSHQSSVNMVNAALGIAIGKTPK